MCSLAGNTCWLVGGLVGGGFFFSFPERDGVLYIEWAEVKSVPSAYVALSLCTFHVLWVCCADHWREVSANERMDFWAG